MKNWKLWLKAAAIRAIKTFAQSLVAYVGVACALTDIEWTRALSVAATAAILSVLTSLAGLPEVE